MAAIRGWLTTEHDGVNSAYFRSLREQYVQIKKDQKDNIRFVMDFMKNQ